MQKPKLTQQRLDTIYRKLIKHRDPPIYDSKGRLCYGLKFYGTPKELSKLQKKLDALDAET